VISIADIVSLGSEVPEDAGTYTYQQGTNKLTQVTGDLNVSYGYDANGNITSANNWTFTYDLSNRLITVQDGSTTLGQYVYNALNQRIKKTAQSQTTIFHYDLQGHLIAETNQSGTMIAEYVYLGDQPLAMIRPGEALYYYHNDHLGTPQLLTNDSVTVSWKAVYAPFGEAEISVQTVENPFRFPGQYYDQETGLHYNWNRYYDPKTGRYLTPDPIGLEGGMNLFIYADNSPVVNVDPSGLSDRKKTCDTAAARIKGILEHGKYHIGNRKTLKPICAQLGRELAHFWKYGCQAYYKDLSFEALNFIKHNCERETDKLEECCEKLKVPIIVVIGAYLVIKIVETCLIPPLAPAPM